MHEINDKDTVSWWNSEKPYFTDFAYGFSCPNVINKVELKRDGRVLEVGYGYGREMFGFLKLTDQVYGLDVRKDNERLCLLKLAEQKVSVKPKLFTYDGALFPFEDKFFDLIYSCFTIQHMSKLKAVELWAESFKKIKSSGVVLHEIFGHPNYMLGSGCDAYSGIPNGGGMYNNAYDIREVREMVDVAGGVVVDVVPWAVGEELLSFNNLWVFAKVK